MSALRDAAVAAIEEALMLQGTNAEAVANALATSEAVRAALVDAVAAGMDSAACGSTCDYPHLHGGRIATVAILAALAPDTEGAT